MVLISLASNVCAEDIEKSEKPGMGYGMNGMAIGGGMAGNPRMGGGMGMSGMGMGVGDVGMMGMNGMGMNPNMGMYGTGNNMGMYNNMGMGSRYYVNGAESPFTKGFIVFTAALLTINLM